MGNENKNSEARLRANKKWNKNNYVQINLPVFKETKEEWTKEAKKLGYEYLNAFIKDAVKEKIERGI